MAQAEDSVVVTLHPSGPLHVGLFVGQEREAALEWVPSDTLFAALVSAWAALGRDVPALLQGFWDGDPPFLLTSAFPRAGAVRFYPRPWVRPQPGGLLERKRAKSLRWVSAGIFQRLLGGQSLEGEGGDDNFLHEETVWLTHAERALLPEAVFEEEGGRMWKRRVVPRVAVDRLENRSNLFHAGRVEYAAGCGLWFALRRRSAETSWPDRLDEALDYLGQAGLGGLRSTGHGAFTWEKGAGTFPEGGSWAVTLSRYAPRDASELDHTLLADPRTAYRLVLVGGWCRDDRLHPWRRRSVRMVAEGSLLAWKEGGVAGHLADATPQGVGAFGPDHRVLRYGYAFPVAVQPAALAEEESP